MTHQRAEANPGMFVVVSILGINRWVLYVHSSREKIGDLGS